MTTVTVKTNCGHCQRMVRLRFINIAYRDLPGEQWGENRGYSGMAICDLCDRFSLIEFNQNLTEGSTLDYTDWVKANGTLEARIDIDKSIIHIKQYPPPEFQIHVAWPSKIGPLIESAYRQLYDGTIPSLPITTCRTIIDICTETLAAKGNNLAEKISDLRDRGIITQSLYDWATRLRKSGNSAVHEGEGTAEDAKALFDFVIMFLNVCFVLSYEIKKHLV